MVAATCVPSCRSYSAAEDSSRTSPTAPTTPTASRTAKPRQSPPQTRRALPNLTLVRLRDAAPPCLIFNDTWINSSFDWLSFRGRPERTYRREEGTLIPRHQHRQRPVHRSGGRDRVEPQHEIATRLRSQRGDRRRLVGEHVMSAKGTCAHCEAFAIASPLTSPLQRSVCDR